MKDHIHAYIKCYSPYRSNHPAAGVCPCCRIRERSWYEPTPLVQDLLDQIAAILEVHDWQSRNVMQLETWLKDAQRIAAGMGPA